MKTRSEWGSWEDWMAFEPQIIHKETIALSIVWWAGIDGCAMYGATTCEVARRLAVENYCEKFKGVPLPWRPDYDLSTVDGCKEAIKSCGYRINNASVRIVPVIEIENERRLKYTKTQVVATLAHWQEAAQFAIDNPA